MTRPPRVRGLFSLGIALLALCGTASAVPFQPVLDEFWIVKNSIEIFRDPFNGGVLPPSGPDGASTYSVFGPGGMTSEAGGKLTMTPSLGEPVVITTAAAELATAGLRNLATNSANPNFLGVGSAFEIHGLYDMSSLPTITGQSFGIRAIDRATGIGNEGDNTYYLFVGKSAITGDIVVTLRLHDFAANTSTVIDSESIQELLGANQQIEFILSKGANSDLLTASYVLYNDYLINSIAGSGALGVDPCRAGGITIECPPLQIYLGEDYIRAQFHVSDTLAIPEPGVLALLGLVLAGLGWSRRKKA